VLAVWFGVTLPRRVTGRSCERVVVPPICGVLGVFGGDLFGSTVLLPESRLFVASVSVPGKLGLLWRVGLRADFTGGL
jgi:hypothetical protein